MVVITCRFLKKYLLYKVPYNDQGAESISSITLYRKI